MGSQRRNQSPKKTQVSSEEAYNEGIHLKHGIKLKITNPKMNDLVLGEVNK